MRVCKIWDADYPWDVRVEKVITTLIGQDWNVDLVCRNEKRLPRLERHGSLQIHRLPYLPPILGRLNRVLNFPYFFNPIWVSNIIRVCRCHRPDVILIRDLPLAVTGLVIGSALDIPVVLDLAENYPAMLRDIGRLGPFRLSNLLLRNPGVAARIERYAVRRADHVIVVVDEAASRLSRLGVDASRMSVVCNTPPRSRADNRDDLPRPADMPLGDPILMYLGNLDAGRGLDTMIAAMPEVLKIAPGARLVIIGSGSQAGALQAQAVRLQVQQSVSLLGRVPHHLAQSYLTHADICVVPHDSTDSNNTTISNKLFDYMAAGRPVLVSDCPPTARIVRSLGCGLVFPAGDPCALAATVRDLLDRDRRGRMGQAGLSAIRSEFHWDRDGRTLVEVLTAVTQRISNVYASPTTR